KIQLSLPETEVLGEWDEDRLDQALSNLISNAVKYSKPEGGNVKISLIPLPEQKKCRIDIQDQGVGIPKENYDRPFHLFSRGTNVKASPTQGLGIGLKIARDIVRRHNGDIHFCSELNVGSTFSVVLPAQLINSELPIDPSF